MSESKCQDFMTTQDLPIDDLSHIIDLSKDLKKTPRETLKGKSLYLLFYNPSLRTRASFQTGMYQLGGSSVVLEVGGGIYNLEFNNGTPMIGNTAEHVKEGARVLSRYADAIGIRCNELGTTQATTASTGAWADAKKEKVFSAFRKYADVPIINMESNLYHPCQALADIMTMNEYHASLNKKKVVLTWAYHPKALPTATANSVGLISSRFGLDLTILRPPGFDLDPDILTSIKQNSTEAGGSFTITDNPVEAYDGADIVYAKSWGSLQYYGNWEAEKPIREKLNNWQVTPEKMDLTKKAIFMHCLPVRRNVVVADEVIDDKSSVVIDQAENRLHAQKGLLTYLLQKKQVK